MQDSRYKLFMVPLLAALGSHVSAQGIDENDFLSDDAPLVLTGTRLKQKAADVPASVTVIDRQMIEASGARDVPSLLRLVPGFTIAHENERIGVTYHGNSDSFSRRLQVLVDGRSIYTPAVSGIQWYEFPVAVEDIERIEVIRGPNGASYGSNAFIGVINIITRHPSASAGTTLKTDLSGNFRRLLARHAGVGDRYSYRVTATQTSSGGLNGRKQDDYRRFNLDYRGILSLKGNARLEVSVGYNNGPSMLGDGTSGNPYRTARFEQNHQHLKYVKTLSPDEELMLQFYHNGHRKKTGYTTTIAGPITYSYSIGLVVDRYNLDLQYNRRFGKRLKGVVGFEVRNDHTRGIYDFGVYGNQDTVTELYRLYFNGEYRISKRLVMNSGLLIENNDLIGTATSPRLAFNWRAGKNHVFRAVWSKAIRIPSAFEDKAKTIITGFMPPATTLTDIQFAGNTQLRPERILSREIGYLGKFLDNRLTLDVRIFDERIRDVIALHEDRDNFTDINNRAFTYANDGFNNISGWEMQLDYRINRSNRLAFTYANADNDGRVRSLLSGGALSYTDLGRTTPEHVMSAMWMHRTRQGNELSAALYRFTSHKWPGGDFNGNVNILNLRYAKKFRRGKARGVFEVVLQNALGSYSDYDNDFGFDPLLMASLRLGY